MNDSLVFRKVALDRLASPEQLDQLLTVTDTRGWLALTALGTVLIAAAVWGFVGSIPQNVIGRGILVKSGGVLEVIPAATGQITEVAVSVGEMVTAGQVVARMAQPELATRLQQAKAGLSDLRKRHQQLVAHGANAIALETKQLVQQRVAIEESIDSARKVRRAMAEKVVIQRRLVKAGLVLKQTLLETRQTKDAAVERISEGKSRLAQVAVRDLELRNHRDEDVTASNIKIEEAERTIKDVERELAAKTQIVTPHSGRILEILTEQGGVVGMGEPVLRLDLSGRMVKGLEVVVYVPSAYGKQIRVGMPVLIAPATVKQEEYGMMVATVTSVSDFPATVRGMQRVLKNENLVSSLAGQDAPYEVHAELMIDPTTVSQYRWSSSKGPPQRIESGTLLVANIAVAYRRPIRLVIPLLREHTGL